MSALLELAARCEAATGPDRKLDNSIANAVGLLLRHGEPHYTASLDAAMTLIPKECSWDVGIGSNASEWRPEPIFGAQVSCHIGRAKSPALALCTAALRARVEQ